MDKQNHGGIAADPFDSVTAFYMQHKHLLFQEAWKYLTQLEDVEDVVCETLARLLENIEKFHSMAPAQQIRYAKVIVRNLSYQLLKRSNYFTMVPFEDMDFYLPANEEEEPEPHLERSHKLAQIRKVWSKVSPEDRLLLEQKYILGWSDEAICRGLGIQPQSVRMYLTRVKRRTAKLMREEGLHIEDWF